MFEIMPVNLSFRSAADASRLFILIRTGHVIDSLVYEGERVGVNV